jgi:AcrR family transcriptional regulator
MNNPPMTDLASDGSESKTHRDRLLAGMARVVADKGYAGSTIADVVREAGVSRRTFYEHFQSRDECLIALFEAASNGALQVVRGAMDPARSWQSQVEQAMAAYLGCLASNPALLRTLFIEILALGSPGLAARRRVNESIVEFILTAINGPGAEPVLLPDMALAIVGGINELILREIEQGRAADLQGVARTAATLVRAVVRGA